MNFFSDIMDKVGDLVGAPETFGAVGDFLGKYGADIGKGAASIYDVYSNQQKAQGLQNIYNQQNQQSYDMQKANYDAYNQWAQQDAARRAGDAAARAAAARATERNRLAALADAQRQMGKTRRQAMGFLKPYSQAAKDILPGQVEGRLMGQDMSAQLAQMIQQRQPVQSQDILLPIPAYLGE